MRERIRIGILNESEVIRFDLCELLADQSDMEVIGSYQRALEFLKVARGGKIDLLLMDYILVESDAIDLIVSLKKEVPRLRILISLGGRHATTASLLLSLGAHGVICRGQSISVYLEAIRCLVFGGVYACSCLTARNSEMQWLALGQNEAEPKRENILDNPLLSSREREVMRLYVSGMRVTQIAVLLERSLKTISAQKLSALRKLHVKSDAELFRALSYQGQ